MFRHHTAGAGRAWTVSWGTRAGTWSPSGVPNLPAVQRCRDVRGGPWTQHSAPWTLRTGRCMSGHAAVPPAHPRRLWPASRDRGDVAGRRAPSPPEKPPCVGHSRGVCLIRLHMAASSHRLDTVTVSSADPLVDEGRPSGDPMPLSPAWFVRGRHSAG